LADRFLPYCRCFVADCEVTVSWGNESTCGFLSIQSDRWLGGALQLGALAEFAEPLVACNPLDNPNMPNMAPLPEAPLPEEGYAWVAGPYSPIDKDGVRVRTVKCMHADGVAVNDAFCIDPNVPEDELWKPASSTTSRPLTGKIALTSRGVCTFSNKGTHSLDGVPTSKTSALDASPLSRSHATGQMAELAGAVAALVVNTRDVTADESGLIRMAADASLLGIPLIMVAKIPGASLQAAVRENPALAVSIRTHAWVSEGAHGLRVGCGPR
jgi:hypothetical protein